MGELGAFDRFLLGVIEDCIEARHDDAGNRPDEADLVSRRMEEERQREASE